MKTRIMAVMIVLLTLALVGCDNTTQSGPLTPAPAAPTEAPKRFMAVREDQPSGVNDDTIYTDSKTGCEFLFIHNGEGNSTTLIPHTCTEDKR